MGMRIRETQIKIHTATAVRMANKNAYRHLFYLSFIQPFIERHLRRSRMPKLVGGGRGRVFLLGLQNTARMNNAIYIENIYAQIFARFKLRH